MWSVTVIGGSVVGLTVANRLAGSGLKVRVIEEHKTIGLPVQCSGLISATGIRKARVDVEGIVVNEIRGAKIVSPSGNELVIKKNNPVAYVTDRAKIDQKLLKKCEKNGVEIIKGAKLIGIRGDSLFLQKGSGRGEMVKSKYVIGADGPNSAVRKLLGYQLPKGAHLVHTLQGYADMDVDSDMVEIHLGSFASGFFAWRIPVSSTKVKLGIGIPLGGDTTGAFNKFLERFKLTMKDINGIGSGLIPVGPPMQTAAKETSLLVGDAAYQTKATTGGGIVTGSIAASVASQAVESLYTNGTKLTAYDKAWKAELQKDLALHWKIRSYFNSLSDKNIDSFVSKAAKSGVAEFLQEYGDMDSPTNFVPKMTRSPKFWRFFPDAIKFLMS